MFDQWFPQGIAHYLLGGLLIGSGVSLLYVSTGLVGGMSSFFTTTWSYLSKRPFFQQERFISARLWRLVYALGLIAGAGLYLLAGGDAFITQVKPWQLLLGGFLVGFGARLSNGCTSGHGICGLASLQLPSLLAVIIFLTTGIGMAHFLAWLGVLA
ncbi:MAG: YeeE/YedE thiosulfate transporter family protein [Methylococcaceae bacterium]|nr:YeeE/YedE thiosulfate transporter family protein [Methylococcaceae bacterium]